MRLTKAGGKSSKRSSVRKFITVITAVSLALSVYGFTSCQGTDIDNHKNSYVSEKASSQLLIQINLRKAQLEEPTAERLEQMKNLGMNTGNLEIQRIYIHIERALDTYQIAELESMDITLYMDSWIPPVGNHPTGFLIADMPVEKIEELAEKEYIIELDTAERQFEPQNGFKPDVE